MLLCVEPSAARISGGAEAAPLRKDEWLSVGAPMTRTVGLDAAGSEFG
jgi:hypothetical protein